MPPSAAEVQPDSARLRVIKAACIELFGERGFAATGIRDIAKASDINTATLYHYMTSKEELLYSIMIDCVSALCDPVAGIAQDIRDPRERLTELVRAHVRFHCESGAMAKVADIELRSLTGDWRAKAIAERDKYEAVWTQTLEDGVASGDFQVTNVRVMVQAILGLCTSVYTWYAPDKQLSVRAIAEEYRVMVLRMCGAFGNPS